MCSLLQKNSVAQQWLSISIKSGLIIVRIVSIVYDHHVSGDQLYGNSFDAKRDNPNKTWLSQSPGYTRGCKKAGLVKLISAYPKFGTFRVNQYDDCIPTYEDSIPEPCLNVLVCTCKNKQFIL